MAATRSDVGVGIGGEPSPASYRASMLAPARLEPAVTTADRSPLRSPESSTREGWSTRRLDRTARVPGDARPIGVFDTISVDYQLRS